MTMKQDPAIAAIREARRKISQAVDNDPDKLVEHYRQLQRRHADRVVSTVSVPTVISGESSKTSGK